MPTSIIVQDSRYKKVDGTFALKLRVTQGDKQNYYPVLIDHHKISFTKDDWQKIEKPRPRGELGEWKKRLQSYEKKACDIIAKMEVFSFDAFKDRFFANRSEGNDLFLGFDNYLNKLKEDERMGTYYAYRDAMNSILRYKKDVKYTDIDKYWLEGYIRYMKQIRCNSTTTQCIYLNALKVIIRAEGTKYLKTNPFEGFVKPLGKKRTHYYLSEREIRQFANYLPKNKQEEDAQAFWLFSFRCNGINYKDVAYLKWNDIVGDEIIVTRRKTAGRTNKQIHIPLIHKIQKHIDIYGNPRSAYLFDIISKHDSADRIQAKIGLFISLMNKYSSQIGHELGFKIKVTSTVARHSFATVLYRAGNNLIDIRDALGHSSVQTTENYIGSLGLKEHDSLKRVDI